MWEGGVRIYGTLRVFNNFADLRCINIKIRVITFDVMVLIAIINPWNWIGFTFTLLLIGNVKLALTFLNMGRAKGTH